MTAAGVGEIVVKNGQETVVLFTDGALTRVPTPVVRIIRDTTGAGDCFKAADLAGRLAGMTPLDACQLGQEVAGEIISHFGALTPESSLERFRSHIRDRVEKS